MRIRLPRLSLLQTFGVVSLLVIAAMGATLGTLLHERIERRALQDTQRLAVTIAHVGIAGQLRDGEPDNGPLSRERIAALDGWFASSGLLRGKLYDHRGHIAWSDDHKFIGQDASRHGDVRAALAGEVDAHVEADAEELGAEGRFFEVYVPIRGGVFESYMSYEPTARAIASDTRTLLIALVGGLLLLWARPLPHRRPRLAPPAPPGARTTRSPGCPTARSSTRHGAKALANAAPRRLARRAHAHRPRPLQGGQRHDGPRAGRPPARRRRRAPAPAAARRRHPGPPGRRRVRRAGRRAPPRRRRRGGHPPAPRPGAPLRRGRRRHRARRLDRHRAAARPRRGHLDAAAPRRRGHVRGQARGIAASRPTRPSATPTRPSASSSWASCAAPSTTTSSSCTSSPRSR